MRSIIASASKIPIASLKLIFRGRLIAIDEKNAADEYKLEDGCVVHCMGKPVETAAAVPAASNETSTAAGPSVSIPSPAASASSPFPNTLASALALLESSTSGADYNTALSTLLKISSNIISHPQEEKYRRMKKGNAAFQKRLGGKVGGDECMKALGFEIVTEGGEEIYLLQASAEKWSELVTSKGEIEAKIRSIQAQAAAIPAPSMPGFGATSNPGMPGFGVPSTPGMPGMQGLDQGQMNNMVQMMRNDPRIANNPMMRQGMEQLINNPEMINQVSRMMTDPATRSRMEAMMNNPAMLQQMQSMMGSTGGGGVPGGAPGGANFAQQMQSMMRSMGSGETPGGADFAQQMQALQRMQQQMGAGTPAATTPAQAPSPQQQQQQGQGSQGEMDQTEEEMIAEAIARSLREN